LEIRPASLTQLSRGREGMMIEIDDDVQGVANALNAIDSHICLRFSEAGGYFVAYWKPDGWGNGDGYVITTANELDHRLIKKVERIYHECSQPGYSYAAALEKAEGEAKAEHDHEQQEKLGPMLEQLAHAMRKDLGYDKAKIVVPEDVE
jgi:hypothetical protein